MTGATPPRFKLYSIEELESLPDPEWLIEGILPQAALAELYGQPGVGKSFLALDWALSVAAGVAWQGRALKQGDTVYVSAEGSSGITKRITAWRAKHSDADPGRFWVIPKPVNMLNEDDVKTLAQTIKDKGCEPRLVVIDTLARCFGNGDENAAKDMNAFVRGIDQIKGVFREATVLVLHHAGKKPGARDRGSSALPAAADAVMELAGTSPKALTLKCEKQKDWEPFKNVRLSLRAIQTPKGESCVIERLNVLDMPSEGIGERRRNANDRKALDALKSLGEAGATYKRWVMETDMSESTFKNALKRLKKNGSVHKEGTIYRPCAPEGQGQGQEKSKPLSLAS